MFPNIISHGDINTKQITLENIHMVINQLHGVKERQQKIEKDIASLEALVQAITKLTSEPQNKKETDVNMLDHISKGTQTSHINSKQGSIEQQEITNGRNGNNSIDPSFRSSDEEENVTPVEIEKKAILQISDVYNPFEPSDDNEIENRKLTQNRESLGDYCLWEKHTRSIGSSLALAMGYVPVCFSSLDKFACFIDFVLYQGKGLGRSLQGTAAPVGIDVFLLPPNKTPGLGHSDREKYKENPKNKLKLKNKAENASKNKSRKKAENVFEFLNRINTVTQPKKIETIDKSLTKVEREKLDKERKLKILVVLDKLKEKERKLEQAVKRNETKDKVVAQKFQSQLNSTRAKIYQLSNVEPVVAKSPIKKIL